MSRVGIFYIFWRCVFFAYLWMWDYVNFVMIGDKCVNSKITWEKIKFEEIKHCMSLWMYFVLKQSLKWIQVVGGYGI